MTKKCMKCGGAMKKMAVGGSTTNKLNSPKKLTKPQTGGTNTELGIYGIPNAGRTDQLGFKKGGAVKKMQKALGLTEDGKFGPGTEAALKQWQETQQLTADGIAGPKTQSLLFTT